MEVSEVFLAASIDDWPGFDVTYHSDETGEEIDLTCVFGVDDDGDLVAQIYDIPNNDWEDVSVTATVNDDGSISTGDMSADVTAIVDAIDTLKRRSF